MESFRRLIKNKRRGNPRLRFSKICEKPRVTPTIGLGFCGAKGVRSVRIFFITYVKNLRCAKGKEEHNSLGGLRCPQSSFATITLVIVTLRCHDVVFITGDFIKWISGDFFTFTHALVFTDNVMKRKKKEVK